MEQRIQLLSSVAPKASKLFSFRIKSGKKFGASQGGDFNKKIFQILLQGISIRTISNYLNDNFSKKKWPSASMHSIVRSSFFSGKRKYKNIIQETSFEAIKDKVIIL